MVRVDEPLHWEQQKTVKKTLYNTRTPHYVLRLPLEYPSLAMYSRLMSGPCSGAEKHLRTLWTLILSSGTSCLLHCTSFSRLTILLLLEVQRRRDKLLYQTFPCPRMLAPHSIPALRILLPASKGTQLSGDETAHDQEGTQRNAVAGAGECGQLRSPDDHPGDVDLQRCGHNWATSLWRRPRVRS